MMNIPTADYPLPAAHSTMPAAHSRLDKAIPVGLLVTVALTALMFGTVEAWSLAVFELLIVVLLALWACKFIADRRVKISAPKTALPVAALFALGLIQSIAFTGAGGRVRSLSMDVEATRGAVIVIMFLLVTFIIAANFFATRERLRALSVFLIVFGLALSIFALLQHLTWDGRFYWFRPTRLALIFGPFANRNHYAGYMEMLAPIPLALILTRGARKDAWLFYGFATGMMGLSVFVSASRGGIISLVAGLIFLAAMRSRLAKRDKARPADLSGGNKPGLSQSIVGASRLVFKRIGIFVAILIAIGLGVIWIGAQDVLHRFAETLDDRPAAQPEFYSRQWMWRDTMSMISANPLTGVGLGAYQTAYPIYSHADGSFTVEYAHNDYLQALADAGIVGGILAVWFLALVFRAMARGMKSSDPLLRGLALGMSAGLFSMLVHSFFDFNLQIPSNALLFLVIIAAVTNIAAIETERASEKAIERAALSNVISFRTGVSS